MDFYKILKLFSYDFDDFNPSLTHMKQDEGIK